MRGRGIRYFVSGREGGTKGGIKHGGASLHDERGQIRVVAVHKSGRDTREIGSCGGGSRYRPVRSRRNQGNRKTTMRRIWNCRNLLGNLASSPCLVGNRMYRSPAWVNYFRRCGYGQDSLGDRKLTGVEQRQSSPFYAMGSSRGVHAGAGEGGAQLQAMVEVENSS